MKFKIPFKLKRFIAVLAIFTLVAAIFLRLTAPKVEAAWFDDSWAYRQKVTFTHTADITSERRVTVTINTTGLVTNSKIQSTCNDARFTDANGKLLRYQLTSACNLASTTFDVIFPTINNGANLGYFYYGNPSASSGSTTVSDVTSLSPSGGAPTTSTEEQSPGPISYWKFDEGTGANVNDATARNYDGTITGAVWKTEDMCVSGKCLFYDGAGDNVSIADQNELEAGTNFTVEAWFKNTDMSATERYVTSKFTTNFAWLLGKSVSASGDFGFQVRTGAGINATASNSTNDYDDAKWHHAVGVKSGTTVYLYIDGTLVDSETNASLTTAANSSNVFVGSLDGASSVWVGYIDELKVFNYTRSADQIKTDYLARGTSKGVSASFGFQDQKFLSDGLSGYWKLDESSGDAVDSSGLSNNGTLLTNVSTTAYTGAKFGNGMEPDGVADYLQSADNAMLSLTGSLTLSAWIIPDDVTGTENIIAKWDGGNESYRLTKEDANIRMYVDADANYEATTGNPLTANAVTHVAGVYDASTATVKLFVNGSLQASATTGTIPTAIGDDAGQFQLGAEDHNNTPKNFFDGHIDDARVYNRALTPSEVEGLYSFAPGPVGYWKLDDNTGTTAVDSSGNGNSGSFVGGISWSSGCKLGGCVKTQNSFDDVEDSVDIPNPAVDVLDFPPTVDYTIESWVKGSSLEAGIFPLYRGGSSAITSGYSIGINNSPLGRSDCGYADGTVRDLASDGSGASVLDNNWHFISCVMDRSGSGTGTVGLHVFVDGVLKGSDTALGATTNFDNTRTLELGERNATSEFVGAVDNVQIYNYARTPKQIVEDMNAGHPAGGSPISSAVIHWKMDEQQGTTANNSGSDASLDGTATGTAWRLENSTSGGCKLNGCINIDTATDDATRSDPAFFDSLTGMTTSFWLNPQTLATTNAIISKSNTSQETFLIQTDATNSDELRIYIADTLTDTANYYTTNNLDLTAAATYANWQHIAVAYDATAAAGDRVKVYKNGILKTGSVTGTIPSDGLTASTANFQVGESHKTTSGLLAYIDEVKIYNYALTPSEVLVDMNAGSAAALGGVLGTHDNEGFGGNPPVGWWKFDENTGDTSYSTSGTTLTIIESSSDLVWAPGKFGSGLRAIDANAALEGGYYNDTDATPADPTDFDFTQSFSWSAWAKTTSAENTSFIFYSHGATSATNDGWNMDVSSNVARCNYSDGTNIDQAYGTTNIFADGKWHFITCVVDRAGIITGTPGIFVFLDGILEGSDTVINANIAAGTDPNTTDLTFGLSTLTYEWGGTMDDARLYDYALTPAQIAYIYNRGAPVAWYKLDECQGTTAYNAAVNSNGAAAGNNGTITIGASGTQTAVGDCTTSGTAWGNGTTGKYNASLNFDNTDDYVSVADPSSGILDFDTNDFSLSFWIKTTKATRFDPINKIGSGVNSPYYAIYWLSSSNLTFDTGTGGVNTFVTWTTPDTNNGSWHHIVGTRSGTTLTLYSDGKSVATTTGTLRNISNNGVLCIGRHCVDAARTVNGQMDNVGVYNYALTAIQIQRLYNEGSAVRFGPQTGSP